VDAYYNYNYYFKFIQKFNSFEKDFHFHLIKTINVEVHFKLIFLMMVEIKAFLLINQDIEVNDLLVNFELVFIINYKNKDYKKVQIIIRVILLIKS
jgi:hypothetical protein